MTVQQKRAALDDGYTLDHCFKPSEFCDSEVEITFRPSTSMERVKMNAEVGKLARKEQFEQIDELTYKFLATHLTELKIDGEPQEISAAKIGRLEPHLLVDVYEVVFGNKPAIAKEREADQKN